MKYILHKKDRITNSKIKEEKTLHFFAKVEFGSPNTNCKNYGICRLDIIKDFNTNDFIDVSYNIKSGYLAQITYLNTAQITMKFSKSNLSKQATQKYFEQGYFKVDENFTTSFQIEGYTKEKTIKILKGEYPIIETIDHYIINFN